VHGAALARRHHEAEGVQLGRKRDGEADHLLGQGEQPQLHLHHDAERALAADEPIHRIMRQRVPHRVLLEGCAA
jgi:hypothetical protein